ncbi:MAG TPA: phenylacetate--CoA ligase family protein [Calditrichaeota bacterium]|nr:phenylacetate--CoA ligase family protein [Calditrichota bacterium]
MDYYAVFSRNIIAPLWAFKEKTPYLKYLKYLEKSQFFPQEKLRQIQWTKLKQLLSHAYKNVPFYRARFEEAGLTPDIIRHWEDLSKIPLLTKSDIRENAESLVAANVDKAKLIQKKTSGSTGVSLEFFIDEQSQQWKRACTIRHDRWAGKDIGERVAAIWGNPDYEHTWRLKLRNILLERNVFLDTLKMDEAGMYDFYHKIVKKPPRVFFGHAHSLYLFARFMEQNNLKPPKPAGIISTAMILHNHERALIEKIFNSKVFNRYGCEEVSLIASECEVHEGLHINMDTLIVEILYDGKPAKPGQPGAIVLTDLSNYAMPFIRYKVGDVGILAEKPCSCGRGLPLLKSIEGRAADYIITPEGNYISGISLTENFAMQLPGIKQLQIVQDKIDHLIFRIVKSSITDQSRIEKIGELVKERFGPNMTFNIEYVESIQQEESGKYRFCISEIDNPFK